MHCGIALGSNLGERLQNLAEAKSRLLAIPGVLGLCGVSAVYASDPVDCPPGSPEYLNAVITLDFEGEALDLLDALQAIEVAMGRPAEHGFNTPRTIDLDILFMGDLVIQHPRLCVPHPRLQQRRFVLEPLAQIAPDLVLPETQGSLKNLLLTLDSGERELMMVAEAW